MRSDTLVSQQTYTSGRALSGTLDSASALANANIKHNYIDLILSLWMGEGRGEGPVSYTHLTLPTNREV